MQRRTETRQPGSAWPFIPARTAGEPVTEQTALTVSAYWCCVRVISETISQMPWRIYERTTKGRTHARQHPADRLLNRAPNADQDPATWRELMLRWVLTWGNAYCEIVRDRSFRPLALWPIEPWRVRPIRQGGLFYQVQQPTGEPVTLPAADVLHFRGLGDELEGYSVIGFMARTLGLSIAQENSMAGQMEHGSRPSGLLVPHGGGTIPDKRAESLIGQWNKQNSGARNHGKVIMLNQGMEFHAMQIPNSDAQLLESRQFSVIDTCRFLRVPPHKVYDLSRATFSNITHQHLEFLQDSLGPWIVKMEQQADRKLISSAWADRYFSKVDAKAILRMDPDTRVKYYQGMRDLGAISPNEVRAEEDLDDLGTVGDLYLVPVNMQTLERAGQEQEPEPPPPPSVTPNDGDDDEGEAGDDQEDDDESGETADSQGAGP